MIRDWRQSTYKIWKRLFEIAERLKKIETFLDENYNYFWMIGEQAESRAKIKENPPPVKEVGQEKRNESLRNLAARESWGVQGKDWLSPPI